MTRERQELLDRLHLTCPADAIEAMIKGLKKASKWKSFEIDMRTYGGSDYGICYGCAATCTLMEAAHVRFTPGTIEGRRGRSSLLDVDCGELSHFESVIDHFRMGEVGALFDYFGTTVPRIPVDWYMGVDSWKEELPKVQAYLKALRAQTKPTT